MGDLWYPEGKLNKAPLNLWGPEQYADTGLLHSTESNGAFWPSPYSYYGHNGYPHATVTEEAVWQHIPINRASRALKNAPGGVQTNNTGLVQIEIAWNAANIHNLPGRTLENLRKFMRWCEENSAIPRQSTVTWVPYPASYGLRASQRLHGRNWESYKGWLGHQHADENDHGDPGDIDIAWLLDTEAHEVPPTKELLDMDEPELKRILQEFFLREGFDDIAQQRLTGMRRAWRLPDGTIANETIKDGKLAIQYQTDINVVKAWQALGVFPNPIPQATPELAEAMKNLPIVLGS